MITLNGSMPVSRSGADLMNWDPDGPRDTFAKHELITSTTRLSFLGDVIPVRLLIERTVMSIGDVLLLAGIALLTHDTLTYRAEQRTPMTSGAAPSISSTGGGEYMTKPIILVIAAVASAWMALGAPAAYGN